ncbi:flagellar biosynthesis protein FlhF [Bacillus sp. FJAT-27986]|uniref:flagellar biosynthesis protein FlhF n=1 Tax=Bacillus sp. FJAT-27986 TaxID=1743146 RepID=UPI00080AD7E7|nr:flagellar biosynthesis protein FlhF [Bacillus sp. FJAT-27986]OCA89618.1 flagellar biosynthesis protein FlhF [Bacillus sp. FJAT-27986]
MNVKKFTGISMQEVMSKIRAEFGNDAVILNSKVVNSNGILGLFKKKSFEVIAALDTDSVESKKTTFTKVNKDTIPSIKKESIEQPVQFSNSTKKDIDNPSNEILKKLHDMKQMLSLESKYNHFPDPLRELHHQLVVMELDKHIIDKLLEYLLGKWRNNQRSAEMTKADLSELVHIYLLEQLKNFAVNGEQLFKRKYINIVGPTGVGKTTTIAKIAAEYVIKHNKKIAFITTDTYRIAAIEQLKTYAEILRVPVEVAYNSDDFKQAAERFAHYDHVFIDTAGRNFRNQEFVEELKGLIDFNIDMLTYLVLSATSKEFDMTAIYNQFSIIPIHGAIFTKLDKTAYHGSVVNFILKHHVPVIYMTNGQDVPDDIIAATPDKIVKMVCGGHLYV